MTPERADRRTILLVSDNGHGLGHVTRLMAIARRLPEHLVPVLLTLSEAHPVVRDEGFPVEYFPSRLRLRLQKSRWSPLFALRLLDAIDRFEPSVVVVDHVAPADAFAIARDARPDVTFVWSRRGLWKPGSNADSRDSRDWFDHVLEPGDVAASLDRGYTAQDEGPVTRVAPVTSFDREDLLPRVEARAALGLPSDGPCVLVALSSDDPASLAGMIRRVRQVTDRVAPGTHLFAPRHTLHEQLAEVPGVTMRPVYPVARYLAAFDLAITAAGYNTVHEVVRAGVPGIFVPKITESVDDQETRARGAAARGAGWAVPDLDDPGFEAAVGDALSADPPLPPRPEAAANGAWDAAAFLTELADRHPGPRRPSGVAPPGPEVLDGARRRVLSGSRRAERAVPCRAVDVVDLSDAQLSVLAAAIVDEQERGVKVKTVLLVGAANDVSALSAASIAYETCLGRDEVARLFPDDTYLAYRERRLTSVAEVFGAHERRRVSRPDEVVAGAGRAQRDASPGWRRRLAAWRRGR